MMRKKTRQRTLRERLQRIRAPVSKSREFSSTRWMQTGPRGPRPRLPGSAPGPAAGTQTSLLLAGPAHSPFSSRPPRGPIPPPGGKTGKRSALQPLNAWIAGPRDKLQRRRTGHCPIALDYRPRWNPWSLGGIQRVQNLPAALEIGLDICCSRPWTGANTDSKPRSGEA